MNPSTPFLRQTVLDLEESRIREVANAGMGRPDVLAFWFGESDEVTPEVVRQAAIDSLQRGETFYAHNLGLPELREAVAALEPGVTELHVRPAVDSPELRALTTHWAARVADAHLVTNDWVFRSALARSGAELIGTVRKLDIKVGDLVLWDNRSVMHSATGGYDGHRRLLRRIRIQDVRVQGLQDLVVLELRGDEGRAHHVRSLSHETRHHRRASFR